MDFTLSTYRSLLKALIDSGYIFRKVRDMANGNFNPGGRQVILRHDVDRKPGNSLKTAEAEALAGIGGTYYFRSLNSSFDDEIIRRISDMGHEIGYHYEDLDSESRKSKVDGQGSGGNGERDLAKRAFNSFGENLARLRDVVAVDTICMHGSPLSRYDSRLIWKYFDYGELNITAEPYFDFSLDDMLYLTDTGRRWDGSAVSIRDRVYNRDKGYYAGWVRKPVAGSAMAVSKQGETLRKRFTFRTTHDIIRASILYELPEKILITIHPQRWSESVPEWVTELIIQKIKNPVKFIVNRHNRPEEI